MRADALGDQFAAPRPYPSTVVTGTVAKNAAEPRSYTLIRSNRRHTHARYINVPPEAGLFASTRSAPSAGGCDVCVLFMTDARQIETRSYFGSRHASLASTSLTICTARHTSS